MYGFTHSDCLKKHENRRVDDPGFSVRVGRRRRGAAEIDGLLRPRLVYNRGLRHPKGGKG